MFHQFERVDEFIPKPGKFLRREGLDDPFDQARHARDILGIGVIGQPDVDMLMDRIQIERDKRRADPLRIGGQHADAAALGD